MNEHHYQRIDAGQPKSKYPPTVIKSNLAKRPLKDIPEVDRAVIASEVLSRYLHGEQVAEMAPEFHTSDVTLYALLLRDHQEQWKDAQVARALARLERSQKGLEEAPDPLSLARARELVRAAQWELERLLARLFGQKQEVSHKVEVNVRHVEFDSSAAELLGKLRPAIEGESEVIHDLPSLPEGPP